MRFAKVLLGLLLVMALGGLVAGIVAVVKKRDGQRPVTLDQWPDVPRKPATTAP